MLNDKRVAIVHDNISPSSSARDVLQALAKMLPHADIFCVADDILPEPVKARARSVAWMRHLSNARTRSAGSIALRPLAVRAMNFTAYDVVISNCAGFAKGAGQRNRAVHICYCHGPASWSLWWDSNEASTHGNPTMRLLLSPVTAGLRRLDVRLAAQPDYFIAASPAVAAEVKALYGRNALVIYPPVDTAQYHYSAGPGEYLLTVAPLISEVRMETLIAACNHIAKELWIVGEGRERARLEAIAGPTIRFLGAAREEVLGDLLAYSEAVFCLSPSKGFDAMPLKANASGRPAISCLTESTAEVLIDEQTGVVCRNPTAAGIAEAIERCGRMRWDPSYLMAHARGFDISTFQARFFDALLDMCESPAARNSA